MVRFNDEFQNYEVIVNGIVISATWSKENAEMILAETIGEE